MQVDDTGGPPAPAVSPPMPPPPSSAPPAEAVPISYFLVSLFSRSLPLLLDILLSPQFASAPLSIAGSDGSFAKEGTFLSLFAFLLSNLSFFTARTVFHATQDFYKQGIHAQNSTLRSCSLLAIEVALIFASSNVL